jgi:hypothetical protein
VHVMCADFDHGGGACPRRGEAVEDLE